MLLAVGPYPVRSGQKVIIKDPAVSASTSNALGEGAAGRSKNRAFKFAPDVYLRISHPLPARDDIADIPDAYNFPLYKESTESGTTMGIMLDIVAATAGFGGNPALSRRAAPGSDDTNVSPTSLGPLLFGPESPHNGAIRVLRTEERNLDGCEDHHPDLRYSGAISTQKLFTAGSAPKDLAYTSSEKSAPEASVVFVKRGGCTFFRKLVVAKKAGFNGVIVWNSQDDANGSPTHGGLVNPSVDESEYVDEELHDVAIVVIGREDGTALDAMTRLAQSKRAIQGENSDVLMEVFIDPPPLLAGDSRDGAISEEPSAADHVEDVDPQANSHVLYINGLPLRNTIVV